MIPTFEQFVNENTMRTPKENVAKILDAKKTFYSKKWQGNGYYPIEKYEWVEKENTWERFVQKVDGWRSRGLVHSPSEDVTDREWIEYPFLHMSFILSFNEMKDNKHYNDL
jgi:hypothetical protein